MFFLWTLHTKGGQMAVIDRENHSIRITLIGDEAVLHKTQRALARLIASQEADAMEKETTFYAASLLEEMTPEDGD